MSSNPFMVLDFSKYLGQTTPLTNIGAGVSQVVQQKQQREAAAAAQQAYQNALSTWRQNRTPENRMAVMEAASAIGRFDEVQSQFEMFDADTQKQEVDQVMSLYGPAATGNTDLLLSNIDRRIAAMQGAGQSQGPNPEAIQARMGQVQQAAAAGDPTAQLELAELQSQLEQAQSAQAAKTAVDTSPFAFDLETLQAMRQAISEGRVEDVRDTLEYSLANMGELGTSTIDNFATLREQDREDQSLAIDVMDAARDIIADEAELQRLGQMAEEDREYGERMLNILNYASAAKNGVDMDFDSILDMRENLEGAFWDRTEPYRVITFAHDKITGLYNEALSDRGQEGGTFVDEETGQEYQVKNGLRDLMLIQSVQRLIDDAVVRESDIKNIANTESAGGRLEAFMANILRGDKLTPSQRAEIMNISDDVLLASVEYTDKFAFPSTGQAWEDFGGDDVISFRSVFGDYIPLNEREEPEPDYGQARNILGQMFGNTTVDGMTASQMIATMSEEEIAQEFPEAWERATRQATDFRNWSHSPRGLTGASGASGTPDGRGGGSAPVSRNPMPTPEPTIPDSNIVTTPVEERRTIDQLPQIPDLNDVESVRAAIRFLWPRDGVQPETGKTIEEMSIEELRQVYGRTFTGLEAASQPDVEVGDW